MVHVPTRINAFSLTITDSAFAAFEAEDAAKASGDDSRRFDKYSLTMTNAEYEAIEAEAREAATRSPAPAGVNADNRRRPFIVHLDADIVAHLRKDGGDWHQRINDALRRALIFS